VFGQQADMIACRDDAIKNGAGVIDFSQPGERLSNPQGAHNEGAVGLAEVVLPDIPVKKSGVLTFAGERQFLDDGGQCR
jgi:hypothetical protein